MSNEIPGPASEMSATTRSRVASEMAAGQDATDPQFLYSVTTTTLLLAIAGGLIDPTQLAKAELANRGLDRDGTWVGFDRAREIHLGASTAVDDAAPQAAAEATVVEIAQRHLGLDTLDTRNADALDFHDLAVWSIREALIAAFKSGVRFTRDATNGQ
ncbi:MAG: hypothetical protein IPK97_13500 [Ahniella sp.]|nr:hypothetical protein [Ahniella sp.]